MKNLNQYTKQAENLINQGVLLNQCSLVNELLAKEIISYNDIENSYTDFECYYADDEGHKCQNCDAEEVELDENELCEDCFEAEPKDIFEWWAVDQWTLEKLREIGEPVIEHNLGNWWGRTCSGQAISLDPTFKIIAQHIDKQCA